MHHFFAKRARCAARFFCFVLLFLLAAPVRAANIALTFDDGPSGALTRELLQLLQQQEVPATFFLCGYRLEQYPQEAALLGASGHELGLHSDQHQYLSRMDEAALRRDLLENQRKLQKFTGRPATLLRPPGGLQSETLHRVCGEMGYPIILWSVDPEDWRPARSADSICDALLGDLQDGDILLLHDLNRHTLDALRQVIPCCKARGDRFYTVSQLAKLQGVLLQGGQEYANFRRAQE